MDEFLELGKVNNTHGLKGEVKFEFWCDDISYLKQLHTVYLDNRGEKPLSILSVRPQKNIAIVKFAEINSIDEAQELKNKILYCNRNDAKIEDGSFYLADLIGCSVVDSKSGKVYGTVCDVLNYGSCNIYDVKNDKKHFLIPAAPDIIAQTDTADGVIKINVIKGLFDED